MLRPHLYSSLLFAILAVLPLSAQTNTLHHATDPLTIDGQLNDPFWRNASPRDLTPSEPGVPAGIGGTTYLGLRGEYLAFAATLPEPGGKVLARSMGKNPIWEKDALESPPVEDRIRFEIAYTSLGGEQRTTSLEINPWGGYRLEEKGQPIASTPVLRAAQVTPEGWTVEAAISLRDLDLSQAGTVKIRAERIRSRRPQAPEFHWSWPDNESLADFRIPASDSAVAAPAFNPPAFGNTEPPLEVGKVLRLPEVVAKWDHPAWRNIPAFTLPRNEPYPRKPRYPTEIKWMHDGRTLAILARMEEPERIAADNGGRDSRVDHDDHFAFYFATDGSAMVEILINSVGAIRDVVARGPHVIRPSSSWDGDIEVQTDIRHGEWIARINLPLDEIAAALGETGVPTEWRVLLSRHRAARSGEVAEASSLPIAVSDSFYGPARYRSLILRAAEPHEVAAPGTPYDAAPKQGLAAEIAELDPNVWSPLEKRYKSVRSMVSRQLERRIREAAWAERQAWDKVETRTDWESFRDERIDALRESTGKFPPDRPPLNAQVTAGHEGKGYRLENLVFQSREGYYVSANLYRPADYSGRIPGIIIVHSQHYPKTQGELHDMGELWARTGAAVLVMERPGYGERVQTTPAYRQAHGSRFLFSKQLFLVGESYSGWAAWDIIRSVDYLYDRPDIDREKIIVLGSVAGGGEPAGVAAALDPRISAVAPFNYDQGHVRVHGDSPGQIAKQFSPWVVAASVAPRKFIRAFEFGWEGTEKTDYPNLWFDGLERSRKVWGFYDVLENLAASQAYGLIRLSMERVSHCFSIGPQQREEIYPILKRWFGIPLPSAEDLAILPDSQLSTNPVREAAGRQEAQRRRPHADLLSIPPSVSAQLDRRGLHTIAHEMGVEQLTAARARRASLSTQGKLQDLRRELQTKLGDIVPNPNPAAQVQGNDELSAAGIERIVLDVEEGIQVPLLLLRPKTRRPSSIVIAVAQGGKERFLSNRADEITRLLNAGIAVCLPDLRATGETSPSSHRGDGGSHYSLARREFDLANSLLGSQLKDLRTVLAYLRAQPNLKGAKLALWGDSFVPTNPEHLFVDEIVLKSSPQIQYRAEPMGAHLTLLAALYEPNVQAVAARGGLGSYLSVLESPFTYTPFDITVLGILKAGDIADISEAIAPRPQLLTALVNGRNVRLSQAALEKQFSKANATDRLTLSAEPTDPAAWLIETLGTN